MGAFGSLYAEPDPLPVVLVLVVVFVVVFVFVPVVVVPVVVFVPVPVVVLVPVVPAVLATFAFSSFASILSVIPDLVVTDVSNGVLPAAVTITLCGPSASTFARAVLPTTCTGTSSTVTIAPSTVIAISIV